MRSAHVRFDERDVKTEHGLDNEAPANEGPDTDRPNLNHRVTSRLYTFGVVTPDNARSSNRVSGQVV